MLGIMLGKCSQPRWRTDRAGRMRMHTEMLVSNLRAQIVEVRSLPSTAEETAEELYGVLWDAWAMWSWVQYKSIHTPGKWCLLFLSFCVFFLLDK